MPNRRFPMIPVVATIMKVLSILFLLITVYLGVNGVMKAVGGWSGGVSQFGSALPAVTGFVPRLLSLLDPIYNTTIGAVIAMLVWSFAELISTLREIEFNTRLVAGEKAEYPVEYTPSIEPPTDASAPAADAG